MTLRSDALAPLRTTALENETAAAGTHPLAEAVLLFAFAEARLKCAFHVDNPCMIRMKMMPSRGKGASLRPDIELGPKLETL